MKISVSSNIEQVARGLNDLARCQLPFATAKALTDTAGLVRDELTKEIRSRFDRPTPWIQKSPFMTRATKEKLEAAVGIKNMGSGATPADYLKEHFSAGARGNKPMEKAMRSAGVLPAGWLVVPSSDGVQKDAFGNVSKATVARILTALKTGGRQQKAGNTYRLFVVRPCESNLRLRHLEPGIWSVAKVGEQSIIKPVFLFIRRAAYQKAIDLPTMAQQVVSREFEPRLRAAIDLALRTAR